MPYITPEQRIPIDEVLSDISDKLAPLSPGELNYFLSKLLWGMFKLNRSYTVANTIIGVLESVKFEFYRRPVSELEDEKQSINGDII